MGLIDREYMRSARRELRRRTSSGTLLLLAGATVVATALWVFTKPPGWMAQQYANLRGEPRLPVSARPVEPPANIQPVTEEAAPTAPPRADRQVTTPRGRPPQTAITPAAQPSTSSNQPGTIYRCKAYGGGMFWSNQHCNQQRALIDRIASVPVGIAFEQQVRIAEGEAHAIEQSVRREQADGARAAACASLQHERDTIWKRSGSGAGYVSLDQLGADQTRWRQIERLMAENRCVRR